MQNTLGLMAVAVVLAGCGGPRESNPDAAASPAMGTEGTRTTDAYASPAASAPMGAISGEFAAEVVAVDATARTVTLREAPVGGTAATGTGEATTGATAPGGTTTLSVGEMAGASLGDLKTGDRVVVSCTMGGTAGGTTTGSPAGTLGTATTMSGSVLSSCGTVTAIRKAG